MTTALQRSLPAAHRRPVAPAARVSIHPTTRSAAMTVSSVRDEYAWLGRNLQRGWSRESQSLVSEGGKFYDVVRVRRADGSTADYWFDVTTIFRGFAAAAGMSLEVDDSGIRVNGRPACTLPSATSACDLMSGDIRALPRAAFHTAGRAVLIGIGIFAAGERDPARLAKSSIGAALAIEAFALAWAATHQ